MKNVVHNKTFIFQFERTFANSHEAILFRRVLQDKVQRQLLLRYLSIKQTPHSNSLMSFSRQNIEFWLEVQRYKVHDDVVVASYNDAEALLWCNVVRTWEDIV